MQPITEEDHAGMGEDVHPGDAGIRGALWEKRSARGGAFACHQPAARVLGQGEFLTFIIP